MSLTCVHAVTLLLVMAVLDFGAMGLLLDGTDDQGTESRLEALERLTTDLSTRLDECSRQGSSYPAFMAILSADVVHCTAHQHVIFETVTTNVGGGYSSDHGVFTAPVAGTYSFSVTLTLYPQSTHRTVLVKNNATNVIGYIHADPHDIYLLRSISVVTHLDVNDDVWMMCLSDSRIDGANGGSHNVFHSHISGFLISPDPPASV